MNAIEAAGLTYRYAGRNEPVLTDISFVLPPSSCSLLVGSTGSGKSTLLAALAGLVPHHRRGEMHGTVRIFGSDTRGLPPEHRAAQIGLVLQSPDDQLCTTRVWAEVAFGLESLEVPAEEIPDRIQEALQMVGLADLHDARTNELSGGQKQRLLWAAALAMRPSLLLLDEPLSQLDSNAARECVQLLTQLRAAGQTIVVAEHRLEEILPICDELLVLQAGRLAQHANCRDLSAVASALTAATLPPPERLAVANGYGFATLPDVAQLAETIALRAAQSSPIPTPPSRDNTHPPGSSSPLLQAEQLSFRFAQTQMPVWEGVGFDICPGDRIAVIGGNGSGKSTLLAVLAGLMTPGTGELHWAPAEHAGRLDAGLVLQNPDLMLFCPTVRDELAFGPRQLNFSPTELDEAVADATHQLGLDALLREPPLGLSQGQRLRCAVAATLTVRPRLLLLDEPTTGQDPAHIVRMMHALTSGLTTGQSAQAVMFSTHDLRTVMQFANRVLVLGQGTLLASGAPDVILADDQLLDQAGLRRPFWEELRQQLQREHGLHLASQTPAELLEVWP